MVDGGETTNDRWAGDFHNGGEDDAVVLIPMQHVNNVKPGTTTTSMLSVSENHVVDVTLTGGTPGIPTRVNTSKSNFEPERWKTIMSIVYFLVGSFFTTFIETVVHDRLPDAEVHPPLPDMVLDNIPITPWAGTISEVIIVFLICILITIFILHKHRFILLRRFLCVLTTMYLIRDATILVTSLPECGQQIPCTHEVRTTWTRLSVAFFTFIKLGMTSTGARLCGAYIFSGHTMMITNVCCFITEYSSKRLISLHITAWVLGVIAMLCILAAHGHYTVDVILGFYITYSVFIHYHSLASSPSLRRRFKWTKVCFPMLFFLECNVRGFIPNEYEWPLPRPVGIKHVF